MFKNFVFFFIEIVFKMVSYEPKYMWKHLPLGPVLKCHHILCPHEPCHLSTSILCFTTLNWPRWPHSQNSYITPGIQIQPNLVEVVDLVWIISAYEIA